MWGIWGTGQDDRNVRIFPIGTKGCVALRDPYSEPFSTSVLRGPSFRIASACFIFSSVFPQSASPLSSGVKHGEYRHTPTFSVQSPILLKEQQN